MQLLSPHNYHQLHGAHSTIKALIFKMVLKNYNILILINIQEDNLNTTYNYYVTSSQKKRHGPLLRLVMVSIGLDSLELLGNLIIYTDISRTEG